MQNILKLRLFTTGFNGKNLKFVRIKKGLKILHNLFFDKLKLLFKNYNMSITQYNNINQDKVIFNDENINNINNIDLNESFF